MSKKYKIYVLISTILFLIAYIWVSVAYMMGGIAYIPSLEVQIFLFVTGINLFISSLFHLLRKF